MSYIFFKIDLFLCFFLIIQLSLFNILSGSKEIKMEKGKQKCKRCGKEKDKLCFISDGMITYCTTCDTCREQRRTRDNNRKQGITSDLQKVSKIVYTERTIDGEQVRGKECSKCKDWKPKDEFNNSTSGDLENKKHRCRACEADDRKKAREKREAEREKNGYYGDKKNKNKEVKKDEKYCPTCDDIKKKTEFNKGSGRGDGLAGICAECSREMKRNKRKNDKEYVKKEKEYYKKYVKSGRRSAVDKKRYKKNKKEIMEKYKTDMTFRVMVLCRNRFSAAMRNQNVKKSKPFGKIIACKPEELREYIEKQFITGMNWNNIHIDHKKPCISFDLTKIEEQEKCFNFRNIQPLLVKDNLKKGSKLDYEITYEDIEEEIDEDIKRKQKYDFLTFMVDLMCKEHLEKIDELHKDLVI